mgnify:CR=1 FL=1
MQFGTCDRFDLLKVEANNTPLRLARSFAQRVHPLYRNLAPAAGRAAQIDDPRARNQQPVLYIQLQDIVRGPAALPISHWFSLPFGGLLGPSG